MTLLERLREAGISDENIIITFQSKSGGYSSNSKRSYSFGNSENPDNFWGELFFNKDGKLYKITEGNLLRSKKSQIDFIETTLNDIYGNHGYIIHHRILFSQKPLKGQFQWKNDFRIRPCSNTNHIGKGLAWGLKDLGLTNNEKHFGPPFPFILEVRTKKSSNHLIETNRFFEALDYYEWLLGLLLPHLLGSQIKGNSQPKWTMLQIGNNVEYHLAYESFGAHESDIELSDNFTKLEIPNVPRYEGNVDYYNHLWFKSKEIELPVNFEYYLECFDNLNYESKENFRRSLYWFNTGSRLYNQEQLSIIPFTVAIECLLPNPSIETCPTCEKPKGDGPTKLFKDFLENHLSLPENINHLKKSIYPKRSSMVHGSYAFASDNGFYSIGKFDDSEDMIENFIRRALINWLVNGTIT